MCPAGVGLGYVRVPIARDTKLYKTLLINYHVLALSTQHRHCPKWEKKRFDNFNNSLQNIHICGILGNSQA